MRSRRNERQLRPGPASSQPVRLQADGPVVITGRLGADAIEGGGAYLEARDGRRYEVIWPKGWRLDRSRLALVDDLGRTVADPRVEIVVRGAIARDRASFRQIGPIIRADSIEVRGP